jgi:hypothetical protein
MAQVKLLMEIRLAKINVGTKSSAMGKYPSTKWESIFEENSALKEYLKFYYKRC